MRSRLEAVRKFGQISGADKRRLLRAAFELPLVWGALRLFGLAKAQRFLKMDASHVSEPANPSTLSSTEIEREAWAINAAANFLPGQRHCLPRSLLLQSWLARRGQRSDLRIGVRFLKGELEAHAWLENEGTPLNESPDVVAEFVTLQQSLFALPLQSYSGSQS